VGDDRLLVARVTREGIVLGPGEALERHLHHVAAGAEAVVVLHVATPKAPKPSTIAAAPAASPILTPRRRVNTHCTITARCRHRSRSTAAATMTPTMNPTIWNHWGRLKKNRSTAATPPGSGGGPTAICWRVSMSVPLRYR